MANKLPHRFSESAFRKYEKCIAIIVENYPKATKIDPATLGLASETVRGRLRDAWTSLVTHNWDSEVVDKTRFITIDQNELVISLRPDGSVVAGTKDTVKIDECHHAVDVVADSEVLDMTSQTHSSMVHTLCLLAHNNALSKKVKFDLSERGAEELTQTYDIGLVKQNDGSYLLL